MVRMSVVRPRQHDDVRASLGDECIDIAGEPCEIIGQPFVWAAQEAEVVGDAEEFARTHRFATPLPADRFPLGPLLSYGFAVGGEADTGRNTLLPKKRQGPAATETFVVGMGGDDRDTLYAWKSGDRAPAFHAHDRIGQPPNAVGKSGCDPAP
jgi:hypothetical protein